MQQLKTGVEKLLRRLVGRWRFTLGDTKHPYNRLYMVQGISETEDNVVAFGHDEVDHTPFDIEISPTTIHGTDYLFYMTDIDYLTNTEETEGRYMRNAYFLNQNENYLSGVFVVYEVAGPRFRDWNPDTDTILMRGSFMAHRRPKDED